MQLLLWTMLGGAAGSGLRLDVKAGMERLWGSLACWSLCQSVGGRWPMAARLEMLALRFARLPVRRVLLATGVLGGGRWLSAYARDFASLLDRQQQPVVGVDLVGSLVL